MGKIPKENKSLENKNFSFPVFFSHTLNFVALLLIIGIIIYFFLFAFKTNTLDNKQSKKETFNIILNSKGKININEIQNLVDLKIKEHFNELKDLEKERNENLKYYSTLIGFILSIVGLFGFKSIYDTKQQALDSVKSQSEDVAKKITNEKVKDLTKENVEFFLKNEGKKDIEIIAEKIASEKGLEVAKSKLESLQSDNVEFRKGLREDLEVTQKTQREDYFILLKRIQELEKKLYGEPDFEENLGKTVLNETIDNEKPAV